MSTDPRIAESAMTIAQLRAALDGLPDDMPVVMSRDAEGNGYSPLAGALVAAAPRRTIGVAVTAPEVRAAAELIHDALDAADIVSIGFHDRETGAVDMTSDELAGALLAAGWVPPAEDEQ